MKTSTPPTHRHKAETGSETASMPFVLSLAVLASATAAPTTKGRRANEQPKVRLVVTGETNVARTTRGARASNRVAQMAADGNVKDVLDILTAEQFVYVRTRANPRVLTRTLLFLSVPFC